MLTNEDIKKMTEVFATREGIVLKEDFEELREDFRKLQTALIHTRRKLTPIFKKR